MQNETSISIELFKASIELYKHADNAYFSQWEMLGGVSLAYLSFIFSDFFNKLKQLGHYMIMLMLGYYFYLNSLWILVSVDVLRANSKIINVVAENGLSNTLFDDEIKIGDRMVANMLFLKDWEIITIHWILGGLLVCVGLIRIFTSQNR